MRLNARSLFVASVTSNAIVCAPIHRLVFPIVRPRSSNLARISPYARAAVESRFSIGRS